MSSKYDVPQEQYEAGEYAEEASRSKDPMMQPCRRGCGELVHLENDGFHVCRTSKTTSKPADQFRKAERQIDLLPCRLCGSPAELWQRWLRDDIWQSFGACTNREDVDGEACHFLLPDSPHFYRDRRKDAALYWNLIMGPRDAIETQPVGSSDLVEALLDTYKEAHRQPFNVQTNVAFMDARRAVLAGMRPAVETQPVASESLNPGVVVLQIRHNVETAKALNSPFACVAQDVATFAADSIEQMQEEIRRYKAWAAACDEGPPSETAACQQCEGRKQALDQEVHEVTRYKQALQRANGFLIMHNLEPVKLEYSSEDPRETPEAPPSREHALRRIEEAVRSIEICCDHFGFDPAEFLADRRAVEPSDTPQAVLKWAVDSFGPIALNRDERAARMTEEAIEVAQVEGVSLEIIQRIAARVYSRPVGELGQEIGGLVLGLYALAANAGVDVDGEFNREFARVLSKPKDWWARKHAEKVAAGTADLTPVKASGLQPGDVLGTARMVYSGKLPPRKLDDEKTSGCLVCGEPTNGRKYCSEICEADDTPQ